MNVQAFLNNISFPKSLEELGIFADKFNVEEILTVSETEWTVPRWAVKGDIVFFFHAKTAIQWIRKLETQLKKDQAFLPAEKERSLENALKRARRLYDDYGGKIFAIGQVSDRPFYDYQDGDEVYHWNSRFYSEINQICVLQRPIDMAEFSDFLIVIDTENVYLYNFSLNQLQLVKSLDEIQVAEDIRKTRDFIIPQLKIRC